MNDKFINMLITNNKDQWEFWQETLSRGTYSALGKTKDDAVNLCGYYEGR